MAHGMMPVCLFAIGLQSDLKREQNRKSGSPYMRGLSPNRWVTPFIRRGADKASNSVERDYRRRTRPA
jgi:hypothetical protein